MARDIIPIIYEDDFVLVIDKPSGLLVVPAGREKGPDAVKLVNTMLKARGIDTAAYPCHRLDQDTSGLVIFAKSKSLQQKIMDQFRERKVRKSYIAFINGRLQKKTGTLTGYIEGGWPYHQREKKKLAITHYAVLRSADDFSVVSVEPVTGRTNQIRIQFRDCGHPLVGERRFAFARDWPTRFRRVALHAAEITFAHPVSHKKLSFCSELPQDMAAFLNQYGINWSDR